VVRQRWMDLNMDWWAEKQVELFETRGIQPWQCSCWIHTHPAGIERPSVTDEATMRESARGGFGTWDFAVMIILTKPGRFYARVDFNHDFGPPQSASGGFSQRFNVQCEVEVLWTEAGDEAIGRETLTAWDKELKELAREMPPLTSGSLGEPWSATGNRERRAAVSTPDFFGKETDKPNLCRSSEITSEVSDCVRACTNSGIDPDDPPAGPKPLWPGEGPDVFERYFGRRARQEDLDRLELEAGFFDW